MSNREIKPEDNKSETTEVTRLITKNLDGDYYPEFPRDVVIFYSRIVKAYYYTELQEDEIEALGQQARKLFDEELLKENPEEEFFDNLKEDIRQYNEVERKIHGFTVEKSADIDTFMFKGMEYAKVTAGYIVREKGKTATIYEDYILRKDQDGKWKILYWEVAHPSDEDDE